MTVRGAAVTVALAVFIVAGALLGLNVSQAQVEGANPASAIVIDVQTHCGGGPANWSCGTAATAFHEEAPETRWFRFNAQSGWAYEVLAFAGPVTELSVFDQNAASVLEFASGVLDASLEWQAPATGDYYLKLHSPVPLGFYVEAAVEVFGQGPETPSLPAPPTPTPTPTPAPIVRCPVTDPSGWFEPVQGVWQDDYTFDDKPGKRLDGPYLSTAEPHYYYRAELDMVQGRDTLLFGIKGSTDPNNDPKRKVIQLAGNTRGTIEVPVHFEFFLDGVRIHKDSTQSFPKLDAREGECGEPALFEAPLPVPNGIPTGESFKINTPNYTLRAKLVRDDGGDTGIEIAVKGQSVAVTGPETHFVPVLLQPQTSITKRYLEDQTKRMADEAEKFIPDYYPLPPGGLPTVAHNWQDMSYIDVALDDAWWAFMAQAWDATGLTRIQWRQNARKCCWRTSTISSRPRASLLEPKEWLWCSPERTSQCSSRRPIPAPLLKRPRSSLRSWVRRTWASPTSWPIPCRLTCGPPMEWRPNAVRRTTGPRPTLLMGSAL